MTAPAELVEAAVTRALTRACLALPHLAGLAALVRVVPDERTPTIGVFQSGTLVVNAPWFLTLSEGDGAFVAAHELLHLALRTHERGSGADAQRVNVAHDWIINDLLEQVFQRPPPAGGLRLPGARSSSLEQLLLRLAPQGLPKFAWQRSTPQVAPPAAETVLGSALRRAGLGGPTPPEAVPDRLDVLDAATEDEWFGAGAGERDPQRRALRQAASNALASEIVAAREEGTATSARGVEAREAAVEIAALNALRAPPWEGALQACVEAATPGARTFARPSRRGEGHGGVVLRGRRREGWTLNLVLDTSASMLDALAEVLGQLATFCEASGVEEVRIVQCDAAVSMDARVPISDLRRFSVRGLGGSDLTPAFEHLARDPDVDVALVITDGDTGIPSSAPPFQVIWAFTSDGDFYPPYGSKMRVHLPLTNGAYRVG